MPSSGTILIFLMFRKESIVRLEESQGLFFLNNLVHREWQSGESNLFISFKLPSKLLFCKYFEKKNFSKSRGLTFNNTILILTKEAFEIIHPFPNKVCLAPLAVGQRAYVMARCLSCVRASVWPCVCLSVRVLTFSLNIFSETTDQILMKFHRNVPAMVL